MIMGVVAFRFLASLGNAGATEQRHRKRIFCVLILGVMDAHVVFHPLKEIGLPLSASSGPVCAEGTMCLCGTRQLMSLLILLMSVERAFG